MNFSVGNRKHLLNFKARRTVIGEEEDKKQDIHEEKGSLGRYVLKIWIKCLFLDDLKIWKETNAPKVQMELKRIELNDHNSNKKIVIYSKF